MGDELFQKSIRDKIAGQKQYYATASSIYAENSILNPDIDKVLFCIAAMLQAQIYESAKAHPWGFVEKYSEFVIEPTLPSEEGGFMESIPDHVLQNETLNDANLRAYILDGRVPTVHTIFRYINTIFDGAKFSPECNLIAMVYLHRLTNSVVMLSCNNFRGIWLGAVVLAQKMFDDVALRTGSFVNLLPGVTKAQLIRIERVFFCGIECSTNVSRSTYTSYYFSLYQLFGDITRQQSGGDTEPTSTAWNLKPLSVARAKRITYRSSANSESGGSSSSRGGSSSTFGSISSQFAKSPVNKAESTSRSGSLSAAAGAAVIHDSIALADKLHSTPRTRTSNLETPKSKAAFVVDKLTPSGVKSSSPPTLNAYSALDHFIAERTRREEEVRMSQTRDHRSYFYSGKFNSHHTSAATDQVVSTTDGSSIDGPIRSGTKDIDGNFKLTPLLKHRTLEDVTIVDTSRFVLS